MGQTLSEPVTEKFSDRGGDERLLYGLSTMQGWRITMEDSHAAVLDLKPEDDDVPDKENSKNDSEKDKDKPNTATDKTDETGVKPEEANEKKEQTTEKPPPAGPAKKLSFFGVYDGHGGDRVAYFAGLHTHKIIAKQDSFKKGDIEQALKDGFLATDRAILSDPQYRDEVSGCTASVGIISEDRIYVANAGDSRTVLGVRGRAKPLSSDHKPYNEGEKSRITAAGGFVDFGRVNGNLALSRAIGDFEFKKSAKLAPERQIVTAYPDVVIHDISEDDEFLVFACDGIWDCQSSQAVVEFVRRGIVAKQELDRICENLMDNCLASNSDTGGVGCDNMTMIIVGLLRGRTKEQWYDEVAKRAASGDGPCAPPEYGKFESELRGPESGSHDGRKTSGEHSDEWFPKTAENSSGRVILLGDGLGVLTDADVEMPDHVEEDKDLASQVARGPAGNASNESKPASTPHAAGSSGSESDTTDQQHAKSVPVPMDTSAIPDKLPSPAATGGPADLPLSTAPSLTQIPPQPAQASVSDDKEEL